MIEELSKQFPGGSPLPETLRHLVEYSERTGGELSCDFELTTRGNDDLLWGYRSNPEIGRYFWIFGKDGMHSLYGYWLYEGRMIANAPIVYLNGEGSENTVLANTLEEFVALLTLGEEAVGLFNSWGESQKACHGIEDFRTWAREELGIEPPTNPREVVQRARSSHPDLDEWIDRTMAPPPSA